MSAVLKPAPGTRPAVPVRQDEHPDDRWCTWILREEREGDGFTRFYELKFIHAACDRHARLPAA